MKPRLFVFGDSWSLDYFKEPYLNSKEVKRYSKFYNEFGHWTNHMEKFFQVQNFSEGASSIENIIYQLGNLPYFEDGDRIVIIFGSPGRFIWIENEEDIRYSLGKKNSRILETQYIERTNYWLNKSKDNNQKKFINKLNILLKKYKPIITSWSEDFSNEFDFVNHLHDVENLSHMEDESEGQCKDKHLGISGNYELFKYFAKELDIDIADYNFKFNKYNKQLI